MGPAGTGGRPDLACGPWFYRSLKRDFVYGGVTNRGVTSRSHVWSTAGTHGGGNSADLVPQLHVLGGNIVLGGWTYEGQTEG